MIPALLRGLAVPHVLSAAALAGRTCAGTRMSLRRWIVSAPNSLRRRASTPSLDLQTIFQSGSGRACQCVMTLPIQIS